MDVIIGILLIALAIYLIYLLIVYVILPIVSAIGIITLVVSAGYALIVSLSSFVKSFRDNSDPYATYADKHADTAAEHRAG